MLKLAAKTSTSTITLMALEVRAMVNVNPLNLIWARNAAGLTTDEAARKLGYTNRQRRSAVERLQDYESGRDKPSRAQLRNMAIVYHQPLLALYMSKPPTRAERGQDFRAKKEGLDPQDDARLDLLIRDIKAAQNIVRDLLEDDDQASVSLVNSSSMSMGVESVANRIVSMLRFRLEDYRGSRTQDRAFAYLRTLIEDLGVFVLLMSDLGSYQTAIPAHVFRGFALSDDIAPFVVINSRDAKIARPFTALHELTHVCLGSSGISGQFGESDEIIEKFCDSVAGRILLPPTELQEISAIRDAEFEDAVEAIRRFAKERHVSRTMVAYNLQKENLIAASQFRQLYARFEKDWAEQRAREKDLQKNREGGPDYYKVKRSQIGPALLELSRRSIDSGELTPSKAATVLGVKPRNVEPLLDLVQAEMGA